MFKTLAIETSCDDTSIAIVNYDQEQKFFNIEKIIAYSQIQDHQKYGGVIPELASRLHNEKILPLLEEIGLENIKNCDFISVTNEPGLPGSLLVGKTTANFLSNYFNKPKFDINHIYGHIFSVFLERKLDNIKFPAIVLTASGGHNDVYYLSKKDNDFSLSNFYIEKLGTTLDDAAGEAFDKVSKMLGGPYPGGKWISDNAKYGKANNLIKLSRVFLSSKEYNFSFSGVKSQVNYLLENLKNKGYELDTTLINDISFEFQESVVEVLSKKIIDAAKEYNVKSIFVTGGVSANDRLLESIVDLSKKRIKGNIDVLYPQKKLYSTDNAGMIGVVGFLSYFKNL